MDAFVNLNTLELKISVLLALLDSTLMIIQEHAFANLEIFKRMDFVCHFVQAIKLS